MAAAIIAFSAASCQKEDNTLRYNNSTMGNIVDGVFVSDQGNIFNVTEQTCKGKLDTMKRAMIICDILKNTEGAESNEYDIRLNYIAEVLDKNAKPVSEIEDLETYMNDPLILSGTWISGGYINFYMTVPVKRTKPAAHELNLLYEYKDGVYNFFLRHDAAGEIISEKDDNSGLVLANAYASFPISQIIREDNARFTIEWKGYYLEGNLISSKTKTFKIERNYTKSTFEQIPQTAVATPSPLVLE